MTTSNELHQEKTRLVNGQQLVVDLVNLDRSLCLNGEVWIEAFIEASRAFELEVISTYHHSFLPPKDPGITGYVLLDASH